MEWLVNSKSTSNVFEIYNVTMGKIVPRYSLKLGIAIENMSSNFKMSVIQNFLLLKTLKIENVLKRMVKKGKKDELESNLFVVGIKVF